MVEFQRPCPENAMKPNEFSSNIGKTIKSSIPEGECLKLNDFS